MQLVIAAFFINCPGDVDDKKLFKASLTQYAQA